MITLQNMIFANPQAYRVFPQIANPYNTGITDTAIFTGYIQVTDSNGTTKSFSNTNTIDFSGFSGIIDIDQYTDTGSVKLGRWNMPEGGLPKPIAAWSAAGKTNEDEDRAVLKDLIRCVNLILLAVAVRLPRQSMWPVTGKMKMQNR